MGDRTSNRRDPKVPLAPGYSQLHWMMLTQRSKNLAGQPIRKKKITLEEVSRHNTEEDCWTILEEKVYNLTPYLKYHPGGIPNLMLSAGGDCTTLFNEKHRWVNGHGMLEKCYLGELDLESIPQKENSTSISSNDALDPKEWRHFKLISKTKVCEMTSKFTFELPSNKILGLKIPGQHVKIRAEIEETMIERAYTPTSRLTQTGSFDLIIKIYSDGRMSSFLDTLPIGSEIEMLGPQGTITYPSPGILCHGLHEQQVDHLVMIAAGTGITPMLQMIRSIFENREDTKTRVTLVYCNHSRHHIIGLNQLEPMIQYYPTRITIHHVLTLGDVDDQKELEQFTLGRLDKSLLEKILSSMIPNGATPPNRSIGVLHCGPPNFDLIVGKALVELGFLKEQIYLF